MRKDMTCPKVSIITPSYNQGRFIEDTILSVKYQNYDNIEHIIVDGGSTDNTLEILRKYEHSPGIRLISEPDKGQSDAINKGFRMAKGEIIGWLNSDDLYFDKDAVSFVVQKFKECEDVDILYGHTILIDAQNRLMRILLVPEFNYEYLKRMNYIPQPSVFFQSWVVKEEKLDVSLNYCMDYEYWLRLGQKFAWKRVERILSAERNHTQTKTTIKGPRYIREKERIEKKYVRCNFLFHTLRFLDKLKSRWLRFRGLLMLNKIRRKYEYAFPLKFDKHILMIYHQLLRKNRNLF